MKHIVSGHADRRDRWRTGRAVCARCCSSSGATGDDVVVLERNRAGRHLRLGRGLLRPDAGELPRRRRADLSRDHRAASRTGTTSTSSCAGRRITSGGHGFSGIARQEAAADPPGAGARRRAWSCASPPRCAGSPTSRRSGWATRTSIVAADGVNSAIRRELAAALPARPRRAHRAVRLARHHAPARRVHLLLRRERARGVPGALLPVRRAHVDVHRRVRRTLVARRRLRQARRATQTIAACEALFADALGPHRLMSNAAHRSASPWATFTRVRNARWWHDNVVLVGDAAHTAHFSIGSGTKLAMEDAIALARALAESGGRAERVPALRGGAGHRVAAAAERGAQLDGVVRARRPLHRRCRPSSSRTACSRAASA